MHSNGLWITDSLFYEKTVPYVLLTIVIIATFFLLSKHVSSSTYCALNRVVVIPYVIGNLYLTIFSRSSVDYKPFDWNALAAIQRTFVFRDGQLQYTTRDSVVELILNIVLYILMGFLAAGSIKWKRKYLYSLAAGVVLSSCIEAVQYWCCLGTGEIADILDNSIGTVAGMGLYFILIEKNGKSRIHQEK